MPIGWGETYGRRDAAGTPLIAVRNMIYEPNAANLVNGKSWLTRPGLTVLHGYTPPLRAAFQQPGAFNGDTFVIGGGFVYRNGPAIIGNVSDGALVTAAIANTDVEGADSRLVLTSGGNLWNYDGSAITQIAMPNGEIVQWVAFLSGLFCIGVANSNAFYFMAVGEAAPQALHIYNAEASPDNTQIGIPVGDQLALVGSNTVEFWQASASGTVDDPLSPVTGATYAKGTCNAASVAKLDNSFVFVGLDRVVYLGGTVPQRISDESIEERLIAEGVEPGSLIGWSFTLNGHPLYCLTTLMGTYVYDVDASAARGRPTWYQWTSTAGMTQASWVISNGAQIDGVTIYGFGGTLLYQLTFGPNQNDGAVAATIIPELTGFIPSPDKPQRMDSFAMPIQGIPAGRVMTLGWSDSAAHGFTGSRTLVTAPSTAYDQQATVRMLGIIRPPGRLLKLSGDGPWSFTYADDNAANDA